MNILFTGEPHVGKSTLLERLVSGLPNKSGFITKEVLKDGSRTGFELVSAIGDRALLVSTELASPFRVSRYGVDVEGFDRFLAGLRQPKPEDLVYVDEIGQMELYSEKFRQLVKHYLELPNTFVATLSSVYSNDFTETLRSRSDVQIIDLTLDNREEIYERYASELAG